MFENGSITLTCGNMGPKDSVYTIFAYDAPHHTAFIAYITSSTYMTYIMHTTYILYVTYTAHITYIANITLLYNALQ